MKLYVRNAVGQISRYGSQLGTTPISARTSASSAPYLFSSVGNGTASFSRRWTNNMRVLGIGISGQIFQSGSVEFTTRSLPALAPTGGWRRASVRARAP